MTTIFTAIPTRSATSTDPHIFPNLPGDSASTKYQRIIEHFLKNESADWLQIIHEDAYLISDPTRELEKLDRSVAVAGIIGTMFLGPTLQWWNSIPTLCCGHLLQGLKEPPYQRELREKGLSGTHSNMASVDGFCLFIRRDFCPLLNMTQLGNTWHLYDVDICLQARLNNRQVAVIDVESFHRSPGDFDANDFNKAREQFVAHWAPIVNRAPCMPYNLGGIQ